MCIALTRTNPPCTALAVVGWALAVRTVGPSAGARVAWEEVAAAARDMVDRIDTTRLAPRERAGMRRLLEQVSTEVTLSRRAETYLRYYAGAFAGMVAVDVLSAETDRLDRLAKEFAEFGRLPEGPRSEVDLVDLLLDLAKSAVPPEVRVTVHANGAPCTMLGQYDPLRRAFANLLRNAAEAMGGSGAIDVDVARDGQGLLVTIADHGPGIPEELRPRVFEPYFTTKQDGTGLGLALVRQTIESHNGTIRVSETKGGGATFASVLATP